MRRASVVSLGVLCALTVTCLHSHANAETRASPPVAAAADDDPPAPVSQCVGLSQEMEARGIRFELTNSCSVAVRCEFSWSMRCDRDARDASPRGEHHRVTLAVDASTSFRASADACGDDGWEVADDRWSCVEVR